MTEIKTQVPLAQYTSWLIGGNADYFAMPENQDEVLFALNFAASRSLPLTILGGGSNVLISDNGIEGLVICMRRLVGVQTRIDDDRLILDCWAGTTKSELLKVFLKHQLPPALFLAGLPGDVGGGVVMNAGVAEQIRPREFHEIVDWIEVFQPTQEGWQVIRYDHDQIKWTYRHSFGWQPGIVVRAGLSWPLEPEEGMVDRVREINRARLSKQPLDMPSCGSVFINPEGHKAAQLIDSCGLKGFRIGDAEVSKKHANFIVNHGSAKASEIKQVIAHVQSVVANRTGISLRTEVVWLGR